MCHWVCVNTCVCLRTLIVISCFLCGSAGPAKFPEGVCMCMLMRVCVSVCHSGGFLFILGSHFRCTSIPCLAVCLCAYYHWQSDECTLTEPLIKLSPNQVIWFKWVFFFLSICLRMLHCLIPVALLFLKETEISLFLFSLFCIFSLSNMTFHTSVFIPIPFSLHHICHILTCH